MGNHQPDSGVGRCISISKLLESLSAQSAMCPYTQDSVTSGDSLKVKISALDVRGTCLSPSSPKIGLAIHMTLLNLNFLTCKMVK